MKVIILMVALLLGFSATAFADKFGTENKAKAASMMSPDAVCKAEEIVTRIGAPLNHDGCYLSDWYATATGLYIKSYTPKGVLGVVCWYAELNWNGTLSLTQGGNQIYKKRWKEWNK